MGAVLLCRCFLAPRVYQLIFRAFQRLHIMFMSSNSPFWYCDAGMNYVVGPGWRDQWDVVVTSAGKPAFYTEDNRPFREVDIDTGKVKFKQVSECPGSPFSGNVNLEL